MSTVCSISIDAQPQKASNIPRNKFSPATGIAEEKVEKDQRRNSSTNHIAFEHNRTRISPGIVIESLPKRILTDRKGLTSFCRKSPRGSNPEAFRFSGRNLGSVLIPCASQPAEVPPVSHSKPVPQGSKLNLEFPFRETRPSRFNSHTSVTNHRSLSNLC